MIWIAPVAEVARLASSDVMYSTYQNPYTCTVFFYTVHRLLDITIWDTWGIMADPRIRQLRIKTGVVKRCCKEKISYEKEAEQIQEKIKKMQEEGV